MKLWKHVSRNLFVALFLGSIPCVVILNTSGFEELTIFLNGFMPARNILIYLVLLFFVHVILAVIVSHFKKNGKETPRLLKLFAGIFDDIGYALQGIFLALAGAIIITVIPIPFLERSINSLVLYSAAYYLAFGCIFVGCFMSAVKEKLSNR